MSEPLVIAIAHKLGKEEALRRIKPALEQGLESFPVLKVEEEVWSGDRHGFPRAGAWPGGGRERAGR